MRIDKKKARAFLPDLFLALLTLFACWFYVGRQGVFGSSIDWISQHSVFPDYFRQQFYETGQLFPEFAPNLGGGQNFYNFSYYGLYSPVILPSYFLPFLKMSDYLMGASIVCLMASVLLMYHWLKGQGFAPAVRLTVSVLFLLSGPMIFHAYRHMMFVNYMPFLCMALMGIDRYYRGGSRGLYIAGVFLMIMTSFYYSIGGLLTLGLYSVFSCPRQRKFQFVHLILPTMAAVLACGVLLLPTAAVLLTRTGSARSVDLKTLLLPDADPTRFVYGSYGVGVTTLTLTSLWAALWDKDRRWLSLGCLTVLVLPLFTWLLNGGLYVRDKALIPLLPLLCLLTAAFLQRQLDGEISWKVSLPAYLLTVGLCGLYCLRKNSADTALSLLILVESGLFFVCFLGFWRWRRPSLLLVPPVLCLAVFGFFLHSQQGNILEREVYETTTDAALGSKISKILQGETGLYRLEQGGNYTQRHANLNRVWNGRQWISSVYSSAYHQEYLTFREDVFQVEEPHRNEMMQAASQNPLFRKLMGVKYTVTREGEEIQVDIQDHTAPVIYATDRLLSQSAYERLEFPYNQIALMEYAVAAGKGSQNTDWEQPLLAAAQRASVSISARKGLEKTGGKYQIQSNQTISASLSLPEENAQTRRLVYLQFQVKNKKPNQDVYVTVAGIRNCLSAANHIYYNGNTRFTYVTALEPGETALDVSFGKGNYEISGLKCFLGDAGILEEERLYGSAFQPDWGRTKGNRVCGTIQVDSPGLLITSIPYDPGFTVRIDGKATPVQRVNLAFLGAPIGAGTHQLEICYHAPGVRAGKLLSCMGLLLWALLLWKDRRRSREG